MNATGSNFNKRFVVPAAVEDLHPPPDDPRLRPARRRDRSRLDHESGRQYQFGLSVHRSPIQSGASLWAVDLNAASSSSAGLAPRSDEQRWRPTGWSFFLECRPLGCPDGEQVPASSEDQSSRDCISPPDIVQTHPFQSQVHVCEGKLFGNSADEPCGSTAEMCHRSPATGPGELATVPTGTRPPPGSRGIAKRPSPVQGSPWFAMRGRSLRCSQTRSRSWPSARRHSMRYPGGSRGQTVAETASLA